MSDFIEIRDPTDSLRKIVEENHRDYKWKINSTNKGRADFIKDVAAMANYGGGVIIFGVKPKGTRMGIPKRELPSFDVSILTNKIRDYLSPCPTLKTEMVILELGNRRRTFPFVHVAPADNSPIIVCKHMSDSETILLKEGSIYTRQGTSTIPIQNEGLMRHVLERIIQNRVREQLRIVQPFFSQEVGESLFRVNTRQGDIESILTDFARSKLKLNMSKAYRRFSLRPVRHRDPFPSDSIREAFGFKIELDGFSVPHYAINGQDGALSSMQDGFVSWYGKSNHCRKSAGRILSSGAFAWLGTLFEDADRGEDMRKFFDNAVGVTISLKFLVMALTFTENMLRTLDKEGEWHFEYSLVNIGGRHLVVDDQDRMPFWENEYSCTDDRIVVSRMIDWNAMTNRVDELSFEFIAELFSKFNWTNLPTPTIRKDIESFRKKVIVRHV